MAISTTCCLNVSPPTPTLDISSSTNKASQVAWPRDDKWRKQCLLGVACMVIGLQAAGNVTNADAIAEETVIVSESNSRSTARWSDRRMCPPWTANSLETIVPENLRSAQRRWEAIGHSKTAPAAKVAMNRKTRPDCFTM